MNNKDLAEAIKNKALELGYEKCGIVSVRAMAGYADKLARRIEEYPTDKPLLNRLAAFADIQAAHPWAESVIVLARPYGKYKIPPQLKGRIAAAYLSSDSHVEHSADHADSRAFGDYLAACGLRAETDRKIGLTAMRWSAQQAGVGILRKNNFLYTESGSWVLLSVWIVDQQLEHTETPTLKPCPPTCHKCIDACPTRALQQPYSMRPTICVSFMTGLGGNNLIDHPLAPAMGKWIYGCDACQSACPFNQIAGREVEDYPGLDELAEKLSLPRLIEMDYTSLRDHLSEKFWYISEDRLWKWKVNALNAMKNSYQEAYLPAIQKARNDPAEPVRQMAEWVLRELGQK